MRFFPGRIGGRAVRRLSRPRSCPNCADGLTRRRTKSLLPDLPGPSASICCSSPRGANLTKRCAGAIRTALRSSLVEEALRDGREAAKRRGALAPLGLAMRHDHRRIMATAIGRLRAKMKYRPVIFELMPTLFTLTELQRMVEAISEDIFTSRISVGSSKLRPSSRRRETCR